MAGTSKWLGQGKQQPTGAGVSKTSCPRQTGWDGPAEGQAWGHAQWHQAEVSGGEPDSKNREYMGARDCMQLKWGRFLIVMFFNLAN